MPCSENSYATKSSPYDEIALMAGSMTGSAARKEIPFKPPVVAGNDHDAHIRGGASTHLRAGVFIVGAGNQRFGHQGLTGLEPSGVTDGASKRLKTETPDSAGLDEDAQLLARFTVGDQEAARILTEQLLPGALRQAWRMLGDQSEAEDIAQEAMLRLWRQAPDWRAGEARISTWLYRVIQNLCIDRIRRRRPSVAVDDVPEPVDPQPSVLVRMAQTETSRAVAAAIAELPERQRQAIVLRHFEAWSNPQIGEALGCSVEAVESLLARGRRSLARRLNDVEQK